MIDLVPYNENVGNDESDEDEGSGDDDAWQVRAYSSIVDVEEDAQAIEEEEIEPEVDETDEEDSAVA